MRSIDNVLADLDLEQIDLIKINIEGGEYELLPAILKSGFIDRIKYIQVQFHNFITGADNKREQIRHELEKTHSEMWNYDFVWESWELI